MTREEANIEIVAIIMAMITIHPKQRFGQLLSNIELIQDAMNEDGVRVIQDPFYEESEKMLERIKNSSLVKGLNEHT